MHFEAAFIEVIGVEGGYVNDPDDRGGETKYGITKRRYPKEDIRNLTIERAKELYKRDFWDRWRINSYPKNLRFLIFDMYVNHNPKAVGLILQRAINNKARHQAVSVDGMPGPITKRMLVKYAIEQDRVLIYRAKYYVDIVRRNPSQEKFLYGWMKQRVFKIANA